MNLPDFDVFLNQLDTSAIRDTAISHFSNANLPEGSEFENIKKYIDEYSFHSSAAYGATSVALLRAYHKWLLEHLQNQV